MPLFAGSLTTGNLFNDGLFNGGLFYSENVEIFHAPLTTTLIPLIGNYISTFTRSTTASVTDFEGVIRQAKSGEARIEGVRRIENLLTYSEQFDNAVWTKTNASVTANVATAPDGTLTADKLVEDTVTSRHFVIQSAPMNTGVIYVFSFYAKAAERTQVGIRLFDSGNVDNVYFTLTGAGSTTNGTSITAVGNGWYLCVYSRVTVGTPSSIGIALFNSGAINYTGDGTSGVYIWGAQLENVMEKSVQTVGEYVSTNVLSSPYHGINADGVKCFSAQQDGTKIADSLIKGYYAEEQRINLASYSNDFSNAAWVRSNLTHSSGTLTATAANGTLLQTVTSTSQAHTFSIQIKRKTGTGAIAITLDNGTTWTTKTITSSWAKYEVTQTLANPVFGIRISTSGDAIDVRYGQLEPASFSSSAILTTSSSVTRNADKLKYSLSLPGEGTIYAEVSTSISNVNSGIVSKSLGLGPLNYNSDTGISFIDGANTHILTYGQPFSTGIRKIAARWSGSAGTMKIFKDGVASPEGAYNGGFNGGTEILIGQNNFFGCIRNIKIWPSALSDAELMSMTA